MREHTNTILPGTLMTVLGAFSLAAGCATTPPSGQLVEARQAYKEASAGEAGRTKPAEVLEAHQALQQAEAAYEEDPQSEQEMHLAHIAHRKALLAMTSAERTRTEAAGQQAKQEYVDLQERARKAKGQEVEDLRAEIGETRRDAAQAGEMAVVESERQRLAAELVAKDEALERADANLEHLKSIATVKKEQDQTIITLSGAVLFRSGQSEVMATAQDRLAQVATALKTQEGQKDIVIEGHTDSVGADELNQRLSERRAESVKDFLVSQGISGERVRAIGKGESHPIADNQSAEGRANNRRVQIVLRDRPSS